MSRRRLIRGNIIEASKFGGIGALEHFIPAGDFQTGVGAPEESNSEFISGWVFTAAANYATAGVITYWRIPKYADVDAGFNIYLFNMVGTANAPGAWLINMAPVVHGETINAKGTSAFTFTGILGTTANKLAKITIASAGAVTAADFTGGDLVKIGVTYDMKVTGAAGNVASSPTFFGLSIELPTGA